MTGRGRRGPATALLLALVVCLGSSGCSGSAHSRPGAPAPDDAVITIVCDVPDAELWVDDRFVAHVRGVSRGIALGPGEHRLEFRHDEHHTHYEIIDVQARERRTLTVELADILP